MSPHQTFARVPLKVGSELRITNNGELHVSNPTIEGEPAQDVADAVLDYRYDADTSEHVIRLIKPVAERPKVRRSGGSAGY